ncbi:pilus assembly protein [Microbulbifer sp. ARAS458-1]|uniref:pilus assembly protein n=1 Tax=Microbulbifer sp. ARAS458-1 TaxID=3140242 RepID=UPI003877B1A1
MLLQKIKAKLCLNAGVALLALGFTHAVQSLELAQSPLFLAQPVKPIVMLNMSNDHQLYFKAYDDYTDLDKDGVADTTYMNDYEYYGYFDSNKCYNYESGRFVPKAVTANYYCDSVDGQWSGNFLNWATMTRMDAVRKILYGGYRSTDSSGSTVLERAYLPHDAHSFAKYYNGADINKLTPKGFSGGVASKTSGITFCNTTPRSKSSSNFSQGNTDAPEIRVVQGNYSLWASNERWQCRWDESVSGNNGKNGNSETISGIPAYSSSPSKSKGSTYFARVEVCKAGLLEDNCRSYPDGNSKPSGLLQKYGERGEILFGLMTGSYSKNKSGGVLRKNVGNLSDEINVESDGTFKSVTGIVGAIDKLRIYGYRYAGGGGNDGTYRGGGGADDCDWGQDSFNNGQCSNWGNPQSEIFLESLHYLAGKNAQNNVSGDDKISGLKSEAWESPIGSKNYCAATSVIQFNASTSSYDGETSNQLGIDIDAMTNEVGSLENLYGKDYFVGTHGNDKDQLCTAKTVTALSDVTGTCPDAPRLEGTYNIAGMAYYARKNDLLPNLQGTQNVTTYGVALAPAVPKVDIPVPGVAGKSVTILPACRNHNNNGDKTNCAIVDFKIVSQSTDGASGKLYVNWEDSEQGGDFDQDMWGVIDYAVVGNQIAITTDVVAESTSTNFKMGFGYIISGTTNDGFHAHSGINGFNSYGCNNCKVSDSATKATYSIGSSTASALESPLYYAAKWGGYSDNEDGTAPSSVEIAASEPETYFYAIDPSELEESLSRALEKVAASAGSASSVATNSTRLGTDTVIYQALFNSADWSGELKALNLNSDGSVGAVKWQSDDSKFASAAARDIYTHNGSDGAVFTWGVSPGDGGISDAQKAALIGSDSAVEGMERLAWARGADVAGYRDRTVLLGDIVNSSPVFAGRKKHNFHLLSDALGGHQYESYYTNYKQNRREVLYVSANDGMLHAFDASTGQELFAYVPAGVYDQLRKLSSPDYGTTNNPHEFNVDGPLFVGDAYVNGSWKNILVGTLGAGGRGLFALDITNPDGFDENDVLFDFTDETLYSGDWEKLGNITSEPIIAPTNDGWRVFFGNGYNSEEEKAHLFAISLDDPTGDTVVIDTGNSGGNGLAGPSLLPNGAGEIVAAYAGDLLGNMWAFDLSGNKWGLAYKNDPLFTAVDPNGAVQPITAAPTLGLNAKMNNAVMVYFGTGSYLSSGDNDAGSTINSFYAIADTGAEVTGRDQLFAKTISVETEGRREVDGNAATDWWADKKGWYLDFTSGGGVTGERIISKPLLIYDRLLFPTMITSSDPCSFGGSGWLMELVAVGDRFEGHTIFGEDGIEVDYAVVSYSEVIRSGEKAYLPTSNIKGELEVTEGQFPSEAVGRMSWRQLR